MEKREIPFSPPDITDLEIAEVIQTLKSGWITTGSRTKQFEREIAAYCGTEHAVALNSATACLEAILRLLGIGEEDDIGLYLYGICKSYMSCSGETCVGGCS